jgi:hypothetical protein
MSCSCPDPGSPVTLLYPCSFPPSLPPSCPAFLPPTPPPFHHPSLPQCKP